MLQCLPLDCKHGPPNTLLLLSNSVLDALPVEQTVVMAWIWHLFCPTNLCQWGEQKASLFIWTAYKTAAPNWVSAPYSSGSGYLIFWSTQGWTNSTNTCELVVQALGFAMPHSSWEAKHILFARLKTASTVSRYDQRKRRWSYGNANSYRKGQNKANLAPSMHRINFLTIFLKDASCEQATDRQNRSGVTSRRAGRLFFALYVSRQKQGRSLSKLPIEKWMLISCN